MSVNFKVPASPKKSIFVIDQFQGVDLTNTGSNIDETRSPNAENMVRFVPGKVRKRTGYHTKVEFSNRKDVNRATGTSDEYTEIVVTGTNYATANFIYDLAEDVYEAYVFFKAEFIGTYRVGVRYTDGYGTYTQLTNATTDPYHYDAWITGTSGKTVEKIYVYHTSSGADDFIKIKDFRIVGKADTEAADINEFKTLPWTPAPEDSGAIFHRESITPTIWGCHPIRNGTFSGNRVQNVNRVLATTDTFDSFTLNDANWTHIYSLANFLYTNGSKGVDVYYEFDYVSDGDANFFIAGVYHGSEPDIRNTNGATYHYSGKINAGSFNNSWIHARAISGTVNLQMKNLSVMYEKTDDYVWTPAPEDSGKDFAIADVYNVGSKNYAIKDHDNATINSTSLFANFGATITDNDSNVKGFCKVSFDLYTTSTQTIDYIKVETSNQNGSLSGVRKIFNNDVNSEHVEFYVSAGSNNDYTKMVWVDINFKTTDGSSTIRLSNIEVHPISPKTSYDISTKYYIYHAGNKFFLRASNSMKLAEIYSNANQHLSQSWQLNEKLFILDGKNIYSYAIGDSDVEVLTDGNGYIPLVTISKKPSGGGTSYESLNMLQPGFYEQFLCESADATTKVFHLSFNGLDTTRTKAWILDGNGNWTEKAEGTDYSVDRGTGVVSFINAPGTTPITGQDNVKILAYRTVPGYSDRVAKCTIGTLFGVGGAADRLFLSGNPDHPNWDFYSEQYNPTYFPDTGYSALGTSASAIVGYAIVNNYLATFKDDFDTSQAVFIREGDLVIDSDRGTSEPAFRLINTLQGNGVVAPYSFGYLQTEPLFLTRSGVYAITAQDITGEKYSQNRSFYLDGYLTKEDHLENAVATVFNDQYILAINNKFYILDGLQATRTDKSEPYATRQYVGFYCTNIPTVSLWTDDQALWIGTSDGRVCRFATEIEDLESYNDDGLPIYCCWETPDLSGKLFYKNKTFRYFAIRMMKAIKTSVKLYSQKLGTWSFIKEDTRTGLAFDFETIDFERFSFSTDRSEKVVHTKVRVKKVDKARFKVENEALNEPFGLFDWALEFIESGNYKG